ncbi:MAG: hypothetical protein JO360_16935 [Acidobacteria bacterium]|nr:hypothetical protein [Acidobacteriota bacterium]
MGKLEFLKDCLSVTRLLLVSLGPILFLVISLLSVFWVKMLSLLNDPHSRISERFIAYLLKLFFPSDEEQENVIGDIAEEFEQFTSRARAYLWLSKQIIKSLLPLLHKNIRARLYIFIGLKF